jgi:predicted small lipoprotein YifL
MKKRFIAILLVLVPLLTLLAACNSDGPADFSSAAEVSNAITAGQNLQNEQQSIATATETPTTEPTKPAVITDQYLIDLGLPVYVPGSIKCAPDEAFEYDEYWSSVPTKRMIYYRIPSDIEALAYRGASADLFEPNKKRGEPDEMMLVTFVKHYNISKADFTTAVETMRTRMLRDSEDITEEDNELPNADIIYTFDNEIINYYYRRA